MSRFVPAAIRNLVVSRAKNSCEYCLIPQAFQFASFHVEHIRSRKHGGQTVPENLAFSCPDCNACKGSDIATFLEDDDQLVRFFNPRTDRWADHFEQVEGAIYPRSAIGEATVRILQFNTAERIIFRKEVATLF